jgi:2-polyprenyl-6-methoxyphenol hydroxylase-like FAD-dependent oxidoreductase
VTLDPDVLVLGAGPVGCALALALEGSRHAVRVVDPHVAPAIGFRPIALSHASRLILERIGAWGAFPATPIETVHVSQRGAFGRTRMDAAEAGVPALGYVAQYAGLLAALRERVPIATAAGAAPRCTVHAEGTDARTRERRYGHEALVARVSCEPPSAAVAFERFTAEGPLALLPLAGDWAVVSAQPAERAAALLAAAPREFLDALQRAARASISACATPGIWRRSCMRPRIRAMRRCWRASPRCGAPTRRPRSASPSCWRADSSAATPWRAPCAALRSRASTSCRRRAAFLRGA